MVVDLVVIMLAIMAFIGLYLSFLMLPDQARILRYSNDRELRPDLRRYTFGLAFRTLLPGLSMMGIFGVSAVVTARSQGYVEVPISGFIQWLALLTTTALLIERVLTYANFRGLRRRRTHKE